MDSKAIAIALEAKYPEPPLHLDAPELGRAEELWMQLLRSLVGVFGPRVNSTLLNDRSREYVEANMHLEGKPGDDDEVWASAKPMLEAIGALLKEKGGPYVLGETGEFKPHDLLFISLYIQTAVPIFVADVKYLLLPVSYADFVLVAGLHCFKRAGEDVFQQLLEIEPACSRLYDACKQWLERDDH